MDSGLNLRGALNAYHDDIAAKLTVNVSVPKTACISCELDFDDWRRVRRAAATVTLPFLYRARSAASPTSSDCLAAMPVGSTSPENDGSRATGRTTSRGHAAFPPRCSSRSAIQTLITD